MDMRTGLAGGYLPRFQSSKAQTLARSDQGRLGKIPGEGAGECRHGDASRAPGHFLCLAPARMVFLQAPRFGGCPARGELRLLAVPELALLFIVGPLGLASRLRVLRGLFPWMRFQDLSRRPGCFPCGFMPGLASLLPVSLLAAALAAAGVLLFFHKADLYLAPARHCRPGKAERVRDCLERKAYDRRDTSTVPSGKLNFDPGAWRRRSPGVPSRKPPQDGKPDRCAVIRQSRSGMSSRWRLRRIQPFASQLQSDLDELLD